MKIDKRQISPKKIPVIETAITWITETDNEYCLLVALGRDFPDRFPGTSVTYSLKSLCHPCPYEYSPWYKLPSGLKRGYPEISWFTIIFSKILKVYSSCHGLRICHFHTHTLGLNTPTVLALSGIPCWHGTRKSWKPFVFVDKLRIPDFRVGSQGICTRFLNDFDQSINSWNGFSHCSIAVLSVFKACLPHPCPCGVSIAKFSHLSHFIMLYNLNPTFPYLIPSLMCVLRFTSYCGRNPELVDGCVKNPSIIP